MKRICVCPICGSDLLYWTETVVEIKQKINPCTGKIYKAHTKKNCASDVGNEGFECEECGWLYNAISDTGVGSGNWFEEASKLIEIINLANKKDTNK